MTKGVVDRFRSLPIWRPAPLVGAVVGDSVRYVLASTIVVVVGLIMGFDAEGGVAGVLAAVLIVSVLVRPVVGVHDARPGHARPNAVMNTGFMLLFPLIFLSNIFVVPRRCRAGWRRSWTSTRSAPGDDRARPDGRRRRRGLARGLAALGGRADRRVRAADRAAVPKA